MHTHICRDVEERQGQKNSLASSVACFIAAADTIVSNDSEEVALQHTRIRIAAILNLSQYKCFHFSDNPFDLCAPIPAFPSSRPTSASVIKGRDAVQSYMLRACNVHLLHNITHVAGQQRTDNSAYFHIAVDYQSQSKARIANLLP